MSSSEECRFETKYGNNSLLFPSTLFPSFSGSFAAAKKSGAGTMRDVGTAPWTGFLTRVSFEEWRAGTVGWILESAFSAVDLHNSLSQNGSWCKSTRTAMVFSLAATGRECQRGVVCTLHQQRSTVSQINVIILAHWIFSISARAGIRAPEAAGVFRHPRGGVQSTQECRRCLAGRSHS